LREIHGAGLGHPDLAPCNIRLTGQKQVEIETLPAPPPNATLMISEPRYAAPEMLLTHMTTDGSTHLGSDIYVLGFVSYEALAGRESVRKQLFDDSGQPETDLFWMKWHADTSARLQPLSDVNPSVPKELSSLIHRMIEKEPAGRPRSLEEVEEALKQFQRRFEITGKIEPSLLSRSNPAAAPNAKAPKRKRKALRCVLLLIFALACAGAAWWLLGVEGRAGPMLASALREVNKHWASARATITGLSGGISSSLPTPASTIETETGPMVLVPAGSFVMGSSVVPNEAPARTVELPGFYIDKYEVSNRRYRAFADKTGHRQPGAPSWDPDYFAKSSHPVLNVSWSDAQAFCIAAGKRLPTEAEWEKTARGSSPASRLWANWTVAGLANLKGAGSDGPAPTGAFSGDVSPFGVFDMAGNVHEWVSDEYRLYNGNAASLDSAGAAKVVRGGSFALAPPELSPSWRASLNASVPLGQDSPVGFRCAADVPAVNHPRAQSRP
jgi:sulfatase modifying factor 1